MQCIKLVVAWTLALCAAASAHSAPNPYGEVTIPFELHQVDGKPVYYVLGQSGVPDATNQGHTSNAGFVVTPQGVVVYDALGTPALGWMLLQKIHEVTDQPVKIVVAGHYHADHIYGLQAFDQHTDARIIAQEAALDYLHAERYNASEDAQRRLEQRREALFPWVDEKTYVVEPDETFKDSMEFQLGGYSFLLLHVGPAHSPSDSVMVVKELGVVFSGDLIYGGRVPFLDSPEVDTVNWLKGLERLAQMKPAPSFVIPGHGKPSDDPAQAIRFTRGYIEYVRDKMQAAVQNFVPFDQAYQETDWSAYEHLPAFAASNRGNAYRVYLEMEEESF